MLCKAMIAALCALCCATSNHAQPIIDWQRNFGGSSSDGGVSITSTSDNGYIVLGRTISNDGQVSGHHALDDIWVIKLNANGEMQWQRCLGGSAMEYAGDIRQTQDGGYILIGSSESDDGDVSIQHGAGDIWVVKLNSTGATEWERSYGGSEPDMGRWLQLLPTGEYLLFGETSSPELVDFHGGRDLWLARIGATGSVLQQRCYGSSAQDVAGYFCSLPSGQLLMTGAVRGNDADVSGNHGGVDAWVVSLETDLSVAWQICLGGPPTGYDNGIALCATPTGEVYVAVSSNSTGGDITAPHGSTDYWITQLSTDGTLVNEASFGGTDVDGPWSIGYRAGEGVYIYGLTNSTDGNVTLPRGFADAWLIRLDEELQMIWERSLGGTGGDGGRGQCFAPDGGLVLVGASSSTDGDLTGNFGSSDLWVVKLQPEDVGVHESTAANGLVVFPNPANDQLRIACADLDIRSIVVYDAHGRKVATEAGALHGRRQLDLDVSTWSDGLYTVSVLTNGGLLSQRFVKH